MSPALQFPYIPEARPMPVSDRDLAHLAQIAIDARHGNADPACCEWLLSACAPLLTELAARRSFMANIAPVEMGNKIAFMPKAVR